MMLSNYTSGQELYSWNYNRKVTFPGEIETAGITTNGASVFNGDLTVNGTVTASQIVSSGDVIAFSSGTAGGGSADITAGTITIASTKELKHEDTALSFSIVKANGYIDAAAIEGGVASNWGDIDGTLSAQTDLQSALDGKAASVHGHGYSDLPISLAQVTN